MSYLKLTAALALLMLAGTTAAVASPATDTAFFQSLAEGSLPAQQEEPLAGVGTPEPTFKSCSISRPCGDGNYASCTGNSSCINSQKGVKCDGTEYACPNYCSMSWQCENCPTYVHICWSLKGDCGVSGAGCDGRPQRCICPEQPI
ncbi:MAG TPA: hypothetical protein VEL74_13165, partial [Thermoanaerobaculia bacterium]|nr:hypothetical protein [Thermoanaerobaculia bacterium]